MTEPAPEPAPAAVVIPAEPAEPALPPGPDPADTAAAAQADAADAREVATAAGEAALAAGEVATAAAETATDAADTASEANETATAAGEVATETRFDVESRFRDLESMLDERFNRLHELLEKPAAEKDDVTEVEVTEHDSKPAAGNRATEPSAESGIERPQPGTTRRHRFGNRH